MEARKDLGRRKSIGHCLKVLEVNNSEKNFFNYLTFDVFRESKRLMMLRRLGMLDFDFYFIVVSY